METGRQSTLKYKSIRLENRENTTNIRIPKKDRCYFIFFFNEPRSKNLAKSSAIAAKKLWTLFTVRQRNKSQKVCVARVWALTNVIRFFHSNGYHTQQHHPFVYNRTCFGYNRGFLCFNLKQCFIFDITEHNTFCCVCELLDSLKFILNALAQSKDNNSHWQLSPSILHLFWLVFVLVNVSNWKHSVFT